MENETVAYSMVQLQLKYYIIGDQIHYYLQNNYANIVSISKS
jgi:hypothetical protein